LPAELPMDCCMDHSLTTATEVPEGFVPATHGGPYAKELGPFWSHRAADHTALGIRVAHRHNNSMGGAHGGFVATLADLGLVHAVAVAREKAGLPRAALATVNLSVDYLGRPKEGCWLEVRAQVTRLGRNIAFAEGMMLADGKRVARVSAVFAMQARR
jgi:acyl-coenzyme A thioesterase 13